LTLHRRLDGERGFGKGVSSNVVVGKLIEGGVNEVAQLSISYEGAEEDLTVCQLVLSETRPLPDDYIRRNSGGSINPSSGCRSGTTGTFSLCLSEGEELHSQFTSEPDSLQR
jgi:hypothetical protein